MEIGHNNITKRVVFSYSFVLGGTTKKKPVIYNQNMSVLL